jgi:hypothetical protein
MTEDDTYILEVLDSNLGRVTRYIEFFRDFSKSLQLNAWVVLRFGNEFLESTFQFNYYPSIRLYTV